MQDIVHDIYLQLGPIKLCGVLHATYQLPADIVGEYVVCALFESYLVLAASRDGCSRLQAVACLYVRDLKIDTLRNGRGKRHTSRPFLTSFPVRGSRLISVQGSVATDAYSRGS
jgi:hypothetical protein